MARGSDVVRVSKALSWLLRHGAGDAGVAMDAEGWVRIDDALSALRLRRAELDAAVANNDKRRFEVAGDRMRAVQGHSAPSVSLEALEQSWQPYTADAPVYHGTRLAALPDIAAQGLLPGRRTHVHLAPAVDSGVGKRSGVDVLIEVSPARLRAAGQALWRAPNGVILARHVPAGCLVRVIAVSRAARARAEELERILPREDDSP